MPIARGEVGITETRELSTSIVEIFMETNIQERESIRHLDI